MTEISCRLGPIGVTLLSVWSPYRGPKSVGVFPSVLRLRGRIFIFVDISVQINQPTRCKFLEVFYLTFMCCSTCFGPLHAHHRELTTALTASGFTYCHGLGEEKNHLPPSGFELRTDRSQTTFSMNVSNDHARLVSLQNALKFQDSPQFSRQIPG